MELPKILCVDDESTNLMLFKFYYSDKFEILQAESGMAGLEIYAQHRDIKVIISDMRMPVMNGIEFITRIKEIDPEANCYILTGFGINEEIRDFINKGYIIDCLSKPLDFAEFEKEINKLVGD